MVPFIIIVAFLFLLFTLIISKTIEGMEDAEQPTLKEMSILARVYMNDDPITEKLEEIKTNINDKIIIDPEIISIINSSDFTDSEKIEKTYDMTVGDLFNKRMKIQKNLPRNKILDSTQHTKIISILYDETIEEAKTKLNLIKLLFITDDKLLAIIDNTQISENARLFGKNIDEDTIITTENIEENLINTPEPPRTSTTTKSNKKK